MSKQVPETASLTRLDRRARLIHALSCAAWSEVTPGTFRVRRTSPQFGLRGFCDDLMALAEQEGYAVTQAGPLVNVFRGGEWTKVQEFLVLTPRETPGDGQGEQADGD